MLFGECNNRRGPIKNFIDRLSLRELQVDDISTKFTVESTKKYLGGGIKNFSTVNTHVFCYVLCGNSVCLWKEGWKLVSTFSWEHHAKREGYKNSDFQKVLFKRVVEWIWKSLFSATKCAISQKIPKAMKKIFHTDVDLYLLKICVKFFEKVTRNKGVKDKQS